MSHRDVAGDRSAIVDDGSDDAPSYQDYVQDWRGGDAVFCHPTCWAGVHGVARLIEVIEERNADVGVEILCVEYGLALWPIGPPSSMSA